jgi:hypothetical protein
MKTEHAEIISKTYTATDGNSATAAVGTVTDTATGEIINASIYTRTDGGIYYRAANYRDARSLAEKLTEAWSRGDYTIENNEEIASRRN